MIDYRYSVLALIPFLMASCGSGIKEFPTSPTTGVVKCEGNPVGNVQVIFAPIGEGGDSIAGKSGYAVAESDGTFSLTTYSNEDGAVVGKHNVIVSSPKAEEHPDFECECQTDSRANVMQVEVTEDGENNFTIELPKKVKQRRGSKEEVDEDLDDILDKDD